MQTTKLNKIMNRKHTQRDTPPAVVKESFHQSDTGGAVKQTVYVYV